MPAPITQYHRPGGLNSKNVFLTVGETGKSKVKVLVDRLTGEDPFPGLWMLSISPMNLLVRALIYS